MTNGSLIIEDPSRARITLLGGILGGLIAGCAMILVAFLASYGIGQGFFTPLYLMGATFFGVDALVSGVGVAVVGAVIHLVVSAIYGITFAFIAKSQKSVASQLTAGLSFGVGVWVFMNFLVLPWTNPTMNARVDLMPGWFFLAHVVYGCVLCITPRIIRAIEAKVIDFEYSETRRAA